MISRIFLTPLLRFPVLLVFIALLCSCGGKPDEREVMQHVSQLQASHDYRTAMIELKNLLQANPDNRVARKTLGEIYLAVGQGAAAEKEFRRAETLGESPEIIQLLIGKALLQQGEFDRLLTELSLENSKNDIERLLLHGEAYLGKADPAGAAQAFSRVLAQDSSRVEAIVGLARTAIIKGDLAEAGRYADKAVQKRSEFLDAWLVKGAVALQRSKPEEAEQAFKQALNLAHGDLTTTQGFRAQVGLVQTLLAQGKAAEADGLVSELQKALPQHPLPQYYRALLAYQKKDYESAQASLYQVLRQLPNHAPSHLLLGASHFALGNYEQANEYLTRFVNEAPSNIQARKLLGVTRLKLNRPGEALDILMQGEKASASDSEMLAMIGKAAAQSGQYDTSLSFLKRAVEASPENASIRAELAKAYMQQGAIDEAISALEAITGDHKQRAQMLLVYAYLRKQEFKQAMELSGKLASESKDDPSIQSLRASVELLAGKREEARERFNSVLKLDPDFVPASLSLGRMDLEEGKLSLAKERFERTLVVDKGNLAAMLGLAQIADHDGDPQAALKWIEQARDANPSAIVPRIVLARYYLNTGEADKALAIAEEAAKTNEKDPQGLLLLARVQYGAGKPEASLATYQRLVRLAPDAAIIQIEYARVYARLGDYKEAKKLLKSVIDKQPDLVQAQVELATMELRSGDSKAALEIASKLQASSSSSAVGARLAGEVYMATGQFKQAQSVFAKAYRKQPSAYFAVKLATAQRAAGQLDLAVRTLDDWLDADPNDSEVRLTLASTLQQIGRVAEAEKQYAQLLEQYPNNVAVLNNLAWIYLDRNTDKSIEYAERAYAMGGKNPAVADTLGWVLSRTGQIERGLELLRQAASNSDNSSIKYHFAVVLSESGLKNQARSILQGLVDSNTEFDERADAIALLKTL